MFIRIYNQYFRKRFFNKIMLTNTVIIVLALSMLAIFVSSTISAMLLEKEMTFNTQILQSVNNYFEQRYRTAISILQQIYLENAASTPRILSFIENDIDPFDDSYILSKAKFDNYIISNFYRDDDILGLTIYKQISSSMYFSERGKPLIREINSEGSLQLTPRSNKTNGFTIFPSHKSPELSGQRSVYTFSANIKTQNVESKIGALMIDFDPYAIQKAYSEYKEDIKGNILILTQEGDVIFDSSDRYYGKKYPYFYQLASANGTAMLDEECIVNIISSKVNGTVIAGVIPKTAVFSSIRVIERTIFIVAMLCILLSVALTYAGIQLFSKRMKALTEAMKRVRKGDLSIHIPLRKVEDEIGEIAASFNDMCRDLKEYIDKVYLSSIRQKSAELNALQSQVNPHFLYNTLEAIRMRAITQGNEDVSEMICILATLFRNSIKGDRFIGIREEIKYCSLYLELFKIRYGDRLSIKYDIDETIYAYGIIRHLLQPVIENYVIHGFDAEREDNTIHLQGYFQNHCIYLCIQDNGRGIPAEKLEGLSKALKTSTVDHTRSIGLANANERIRLIFGNPYGLDITSSVGKGTRVTVTIPAKTIEEMNEYVQSFDR